MGEGKSAKTAFTALCLGEKLVEEMLDPAELALAR